MAKSDVLMGVCTTVVMVLLISGYHHSVITKEPSPKAGFESSAVTVKSNVINKKLLSMNSIPDSLVSVINQVCQNE